MKKIHFNFLWTLLIILLVPFSPKAQSDNPQFGGFDITNPMSQQSSLAALLGYTDIGGDKFIGMRIQPEFVFGKLAFGLDVPLMFSVDSGFKFRKEEFTDGVGILRMVRYVSWGVKKRDPLFIRVGNLSDTYIGYGILVDNYTNSISFDKRKMGVSFDVLVKNLVGVEGMYSDFDAGSRNLLALRPYIKPLGRTSIPIVKTLDIGFTTVSDHDQTFIETEKNGVKTKYQSNKFLKDGMKAWALDMGVIPINRQALQLRAYMQYGSLQKVKSSLLADSIQKYLVAKHSTLTKTDSTNIRNYDGSSGFSIGVDLRLSAAANMFRLDAKLERLWYKKYFMPQFFNATYEMNKDARIFNLAAADGKKGIYGALAITAMEKVQVGGSLMIPDEVSEKNPAMLTLNLDASQLMEKVILTAFYVKGGLSGLKDAFKLDDRSLLTARAAYKMYKFLVVGFDYKWTWSALADGTYKENHYASPYIGFQMPFNLGKNNKPIDFNN